MHADPIQQEIEAKGLHAPRVTPAISATRCVVVPA